MFYSLLIWLYFKVLEIPINKAQPAYNLQSCHFSAYKGKCCKIIDVPFFLKIKKNEKIPTLQTFTEDIITWYFFKRSLPNIGLRLTFMPHSLGSSDMLKKRITNFYTFRKPSVDVLFMKDKTNLDLTICIWHLFCSVVMENKNYKQKMVHCTKLAMVPYLISSWKLCTV